MFINTPCKTYFFFPYRQEGKIPAIGLGTDYIKDVLDRKRIGEILGITFEKIDDGRIRPCIPIGEFFPVEWLNAPAIPLRHRDVQYVVLPPLAQNVPYEWNQFSLIMKCVYEKYLEVVSFHIYMPQNCYFILLN